MTDQLNIFHQPDPATPDPDPEPMPRSSQLSELPPGEFEDIFQPPKEAA